MGIDKAAQERLRAQVDNTKSLLRDFVQLSSDVKNTEKIPQKRLPINYLWTPPVQPKYAKPGFQPKYWAEYDSSDRAINAIIEIRAQWKYVIQAAYYHYSNMYSQLSIPLSDEVKEKCQKHKEAFAVYDTKTKRWLIEPTEPSYKYCYNGEFFEELKEGKNKTTAESSRLLLVGKYTILKQEVNLLTQTRTAPTLLETFVMPRKSLTVGVPGCGKTTYIIKKHSRGSLVLTSCAEGAQDLRSRMAKARGGRPSDYRHSYRTIDSYLLNSRNEYAHVWVDEALMEHPGKLFLVCLFSQCTNISMLGDPNQLGYINRVNSIRLLYDKSSTFFKPTETLNTSYRCPVDVMAVLSNKYDEGAYSTSKTLCSMKIKTFTSLKDVPKMAETKYLVFKQAEKKQMQRAGYDDVSTIHEFQGKEAKHVILVRMSRNLKEELYKSEPHILVGISRHRESLIYYTPVVDDVTIIIERSHKESYAQLKKHQITTLAPSTSSDHVHTSSLISKNSHCSQADTSAALKSCHYIQPSTLANTSEIPQKSTLVPSSTYNSPTRFTPVAPKSSHYPDRTTSVVFNSYYPGNISEVSDYTNNLHTNRSTDSNYSNYDQTVTAAPHGSEYHHPERSTAYLNSRSNYRQSLNTPPASNRRPVSCCCIL